MLNLSKYVIKLLDKEFYMSISYKIKKSVFPIVFFMQSYLFATPNPPSNLSLKALSSSSVLISWQDNSDNEIGFKIFRDGELIKTVGANVTSFVDTNLSPNTSYTYTIKSTDYTIEEPALSGVHINEIVASNGDIKVDPDFYQFSDYIELKNYSDTSINIGGYTLSTKKHTWRVPSNTIIPAHSYLLIWADEEDKKANALHSNFKISSKKGTITLKDSSENTIDKIVYEKVPSNVAIKNVNNTTAYTLPTPGKDNTKLLSKFVKSEKPNFSISSGFYDNAQSLVLSGDANAKIYYTLDGSRPTNRSTLYTSAINIPKTTVVKAISYESGKEASDVVTNTYIIDFDTDLPVVSLTMDEKYLYDDYIGIYTDGKNGISKPSCHVTNDPKNYLQNWERPVYLEYYDENGLYTFSTGLEISISGQCSRYNPKKSLSFETKKKYGSKTIEYQLYKNKNLTDIKDFKLRTGEEGFGLRDLVAAALVEDGDLNVDYQAYQAVQMFINGEYWGVYNMREKKGTDYLKSNYPDIDEDNIDIIGNGIKSGDNVEYNALHNYIKRHDLSIDSNYQEILTMIDEDNFIDYMILMIYSGNRDWIDNNFRLWRERKEDAKWRWMLDDVDYGFILPDRENTDLATMEGTLTSDLFRKLLKNSNFKSKYKRRFYEYLNGLFTTENMLSIIDKLSQERSKYMDLEKNKWGISKARFDYDVRRLENFARKRVAVIKEYLDDL